MDEARQRTGEAGEERDDLDALIGRASDRMGGAGPIDVRVRVLARLDGDADAAGDGRPSGGRPRQWEESRWWCCWR